MKQLDEEHVVHGAVFFMGLHTHLVQGVRHCKARIRYKVKETGRQNQFCPICRQNGSVDPRLGFLTSS